MPRLSTLASPTGFHLRGISKSLEGACAALTAYGKRIGSRPSPRAQTALRLRVKPPEPQTLRQGKIRVSEVVDEETREILHIRKNLLPPFASFFAVPVWFGHAIAIIEVGWSRPRPRHRRCAPARLRRTTLGAAHGASTMRQQQW